jgi:hypothetical protein
MAKRCEQLNAMAEDRAAQAKILALKSVREFTVRVGDIRRVRAPAKNGKIGRVVKQVHVLDCRCRIAGMRAAIERQVEMEAAEDWGAAEELERALLPAVQAFVAEATRVILLAKKDAEAPPAPPGAETPREQILARMAAMRAARRPGGQPKNAPAAAVTGDPEPDGGES